MKRTRLIFLINAIFLFVFKSSFAQDSTRVLYLEDVFAQILAHHPIAKQAELLSEGAQQEIRLARGFFDPVISSKYYSKSFKGNNYFDLWDNTLRIPTWFGAELMAGYEKNSGNNINPEDYTPSSGLTSVGISVPFGQGLIIDERRSTLKQAQLFKEIAEADKIKIINKLLLQGSKEYWEWALNYEKLRLNRQATALARFRLKAVKERVAQGDLSAIDSVEALLQVQSLEVATHESEINYKNSSLMLSNYLWNDNLVPLEISEAVVPSMKGTEIQTIKKDSLERLLTLASNRHPDLVKIELKLRQLDVERRFYQDKLKPKLNLEYNILNTGFNVNNEVFDSEYLSSNHKIGISFVQPIFLRRERSKLQLNRLKTRETNFTLQQSNREVINTITAAYNEWLLLEKQINVQEASVKNYDLLTKGEMQRFENGESSLFIINQREVSFINNQIKLLELKAKYAKNKVFLFWAAGSEMIFKGN